MLNTSNIEHVTHESKLLSCCLINVCGLKPKLLSPDFENFISQFDMLVLTETKMSDLDSTDNLFLDFDILYKNRKSAKRASGGVALLTKKNISNHVHMIEIDNVSDQTVNNDFVMWVKIVDLLEFNLIMGITYGG